MRLLLSGNVRLAGKRLRKKLYSDSRYLLLRRDLWQQTDVPPAGVEVTIRTLLPGDETAILGERVAGVNPEDILARLDRQRLVLAGVGTWYVGLVNGDPCYMQCLMSCGSNDEIQKWFRGYFPPLAPDEALLEGAFVHEAYRGHGIMAHAMGRIAEQARELGARWVISSVSPENVPALKGCLRAGFAPYMERHERWRLMRRTLALHAVSPEAK